MKRKRDDDGDYESGDEWNDDDEFLIYGVDVGNI